MNIYKSVIEKDVGVPTNIYIMCLTSKGWWYYNKTRRGEVKFENPDVIRKIRFNAYKKIVKADSYASHKVNIERILKEYNDIVPEVQLRGQEVIEFGKILNFMKGMIYSNHCTQLKLPILKIL